jgi:hypothetical protein
MLVLLSVRGAWSGFRKLKVVTTSPASAATTFVTSAEASAQAMQVTHAKITIMVCLVVNLVNCDFFTFYNI